MKRIYSRIRASGVEPELYMLDNEVSDNLMAYLSTDVNGPEVPPGTHCCNAAKRAVHTANNYLISGFCISDDAFPLTL